MARADAKLRLKGGDKVHTFSLRRQMLLRIASLEKIIPNLRGSAAGIGHNRALDSIEPIPFCDQDLKVVEALLAVLEAQPPQLPTVTTRAMGGGCPAQRVRRADQGPRCETGRHFCFETVHVGWTGVRKPAADILRFGGQAVGDRSGCARLAKLAYARPQAPGLRETGGRHRGQGNPSPTSRLLREGRGWSHATHRALYERTPRDVVDDAAGPTRQGPVCA